MRVATPSTAARDRSGTTWPGIHARRPADRRSRTWRPVRRILDLIREGERPVNALVDELGLSQPGVSKHLKVLREAGLVDVRQDAQRRLYRVRAEPLAEIEAWLAPYRRLWAGTLDELERHLDAKEDG